jgi:hypothetical protein
MARNVNNLLTQNYKGKVGKDFVLKDYKGETIVTKYPDRSGVELSVSQKKSNGVFQGAVAHAQAIIRNPERKGGIKEKLKSNKDRSLSLISCCHSGLCESIARSREWLRWRKY